MSIPAATHVVYHMTIQTIISKQISTEVISFKSLFGVIDFEREKKIKENNTFLESFECLDLFLKKSMCGDSKQFLIEWALIDNS